MRLIDKSNAWDDDDKTFVGKKSNYIVTIKYAAMRFQRGNPFWYFTLDKDRYAYNSIWDDRKFETQDECVKAAENKIKELVGK